MSDFFHGDIAESVEGEEEVETSPSTATSTGRSSQRHSGRTSRSMDRESSKQDIYDYGDESEIVGATIVDISPSLQGKGGPFHQSVSSQFIIDSYPTHHDPITTDH